MVRDYQPDRRGFAALLRSSDMAAMCMDVARDLVPAVVAVTPRDSGNTAATTRAEPDRGADGRAGAKVVQDGAGVPLHFGNQRTRAQHHMVRALGNG